MSTRYGAWRITYDPPPIPLRSCDWAFVHDDYDGAPDGHDTRFGHASSLEECKAMIDEIEADQRKAST